MRRPARWASTWRRASTAGIAALCGEPIPSDSTMDAIVEAVSIVMQWPGNVGEVVFGYIGHGCLLESVLLELFSRDYSTVVRSCSSHESITWVRLHKQLPAMMRRTQFGVRVRRIRSINIRRYSWDLQLHVGIKRLVLWRRNAQLFCQPHPAAKILKGKTQIPTATPCPSSQRHRLSAPRI
jgi:hypothetical protein